MTRAAYYACLVAKAEQRKAFVRSRQGMCSRAYATLASCKQWSCLWCVFAMGFFLLGFASGATAQSDTLASVRERGHLICGIGHDELGFSSGSGDGKWSGLYVDFCRAIAIAVLDDFKAVKFVPLVGTQRFRALQDGKIDILARHTAWTATRDLQEGSRFVGPLFYDGKSFLIRRGSGIQSALELSGADVCHIEGGLTAGSVARYFSDRGMKFNSKASETWTEVLENYKMRSCLVLAADSVQLSILRNSLADKEQHTLLPERFEVDAFGPYVPGHDDRWRRAVLWIRNALVMADDQGVSSKNLSELSASSQAKAGSIFALAKAAGQQLGFVEGWFQKLIRAIGNYGEVFERNLGSGSAVGLSRGPNEPVSRGGLLQAPALR